MSAYKHALSALLVWLITSSASADIGLRIAQVSGTEGQIVSVPIYVDTSLSGLNILSYQLEISYSSIYLEALDPDFTGGISATWGTPTYNLSDAGTVYINHAGITPLSGTGIIGHLRFYLKNTGSININFVTGSNTILNEGDIPLLLTGGRVTIAAKPNFNFSPDGPLITVGESVQYQVSQGTAPYTWGITNPAIASISTTGLVTGLSPGKAKVIAEDATGIIDTADYFLEVVPFLMTIRDSSYYQNNLVDIPVNISSLNAYEVLSGEVSVSFSNHILTADDVHFSGSILEGLQGSSVNLSGNGLVSVSFASSTAIVGNGPLFFIRFRVADLTSGSTQIRIIEALFNENLKAKIDNGNFSIIPLPPLNVSPKTGELLIGETLDFNVSGGILPYTWTVSNPSIATINSDGLLTALAGGDLVVSVSDPRGSHGSSNIITIYDGTLTLSHVLLPINESSVQVPVNLMAQSGITPIISLSGNMDFNQNKIDAVALNKSGSATQSWIYSHQSLIDEFKFAGAGVSGITGNATLLFLDFNMGSGLSVGETIPLNWNNIVANEGSPRLKLIGGSIEITASTNIDLPSEGVVRVVYDQRSHQVTLKNIPPNCQSILLYDITGQLVQQFEPDGNELKFISNHYQSGIYIIKVSSDVTHCLKVRF
jgi:hypothetical protein